MSPTVEPTGQVPPPHPHLAGRAGGRPDRRLSPLRILMVLILVAGLVAVSFGAVDYIQATRAAADAPKPWFAPYVDVTATPQYQFQDPADAAARQVVLGFVVADPGQPCVPSWGGAYTLSAAATGLDLDRRIARLRQQGGSAIVSFGGEANSELSSVCTDPVALAHAYQSVVNRYQVTTIDLDLEGAALQSAATDARRAAAVSSVQAEARAAHRTLAVWLTLPVAPSGLTSQGLAAVRAMLHAQVRLAGVNVMTMDYGGALPSGTSMGAASVDALRATAHQLATLYRQVGSPLTAQQVWSKLGATPMIGQNDVTAEEFGLSDARQLLAFVQQHELRRVSMWSLNRDTPCGPNYVDVTTVSDSCSGISQSPLAFTRTFGVLGGTVSQGPSRAALPGPSASQAPVDNPATSPYPIWAPANSYPKGTKIVWHHNVYQAKWWTQGDAPDAPVPHSWDTPWTLIGPVLPGEHPVLAPSLPPGTYPAWSPITAYSKGAFVEYQGVGYVAKWWTQGAVPGADVLSPSDTPWAALASPSEAARTPPPAP
jgi:chitinase